MELEYFILFLPLLAAFISGFLGKFVGHRSSEIITSLFTSVSAILSILIFYEINDLLSKTTYLIGYTSFFIIHNHYNGDIYFQLNLIYIFSAIFYLVTLILLKNH